MKYSKSTRYALYAATEMAGAREPVTVAWLAQRYDIPEGALAKVMQGLVRAGIARGVRGIGGGYLLHRPSAEVTVLDLIEVFDPARREGHCVLTEEAGDVCLESPECRLRRLFDEVDEMARCTFASVTLETLQSQPQA